MEKKRERDLNEGEAHNCEGKGGEWGMKRSENMGSGWGKEEAWESRSCSTSRLPHVYAIHAASSPPP